MKHDSIPGLDPEKVARLVGVGLDQGQGERCDPEEAIKDRLEACLAETGWADDGRERGWPGVLGRLLGPRRPHAQQSVGEVLQDPQATLTAVKNIRRYAKQKAARIDDEVEHAVMTTMYFAAIASALVFHEQRITTYSYGSLRSSFDKLRRKPWMSTSLAELFDKAEQMCRDRPPAS